MRVRSKVVEAPTRLIGYARVSTHEQSLDMQLDALIKAGVHLDDIHSEKVSGVSSRRPALRTAMLSVRPGDTFVVWKLDRLGRNLLDLLHHMRTLEDAKVGFRSLTEGIDTTTPGGRLILHVMGSLAQFERDLTVERTKTGLKAYRARGGRMGPKPSMSRADEVLARKMLREGKSSTEVAEHFGVHRQTIYQRVVWPAKFKAKARALARKE